jgi:outer membrane receptor protein involved in Fe transport
LSVLVAMPAHAQSVIFDLPAQPLSESLLQVGRAAGLEIGFSPDALAGMNAAALRGDYEPHDAIRRLLEGTGLVADRLAPGVVVIGPARVEAAQAPVGDGPRAVSPLAAPTPSADSSAGADRVLVTGSRIVRDALEVTTPVRDVTLAELRAADPASLAEALNLLPEFQNSERPQTTGIDTTGNAGQSFLNLRSIGAERTLVLLDGRRIVPSTSRGVVDLGLLPESLIERVDVVTGGASAAYGSDAVAGVVNFITRSGFTGLEVEGQYGISERGDARTRRLSLTGGEALFGGRGHLVAAVNAYDNGGISNYVERDWFQSCARMVNPAPPLDYVVACGVVASGFARGGLITSGPLRGVQFEPGGQPAPFVFGELASAQTMIGGSGEDYGRYYQPLPAAERINAAVRLTYDLTPDVSLFLESLWARTNSNYAATPSWQGFGSAYTIYRDNAFLPSPIARAMDDAGVSSFNMSRYDSDFGALTVSAGNLTERHVAGLTADLGLWTLDTYYEHGRNRYAQTVDNNVRVNRLYEAADAVRDPLSGAPICNSALLFPARGCAPLDLFGEGAPSAEALAYVRGTTWQDTRITQDVMEATLGGEPISTPAGPVGIALGAGYRRESYVQTSDPISQEARVFTGGYRGFPDAYLGDGAHSQTGGWERTNPLPASGVYDVTEVFGEFRAPIIAGRPWVESLAINGAARHTDYSAIGGVVTWKLGATWRPVPDLLIRVSRSRDIRAASLEEMFRGGVQGFDRVIDRTLSPSDPRYQPFVLLRNFGNPLLEPEKADTTTLGFVYQPNWLPGFTLAVDHYEIDLHDQIAVLSAQTMADQCAGGVVAICAYVFRDSTGAIDRIERPSLNVGRTRASGQDIELRYKVPGDAVLDGLGGDITFRLAATHASELQSFLPGVIRPDLAGQIRGGIPQWTGSLSMAWDRGPVSLFVQERLIGSGDLDRTLGPANLDPAQNRVAAVSYTTVTGAWRFNVQETEIELSATVNNLFDVDPPSAPGAFFFHGSSPTANSHYDIIGRRFTVALRAAL